MSQSLELAKMSVSQKLQLMETIWQDLCRTGGEIPSPLWHQEVLQARQQRIDSGQAKFSDWDQAKRRIRDAAS